MKGRCVYQIAAYFAVLVFSAWSLVAEEFSEERCIVLANGNVLRGSVDQVGSVYIIRSGTAEIRAPQKSVEFVCDSLADAYLIKRSRLKADDIESRIRLARWCLKHDLAAEASTEIDHVRSIAPSHQQLDGLTRWLSVVTNNRPAVSVPAANTNSDNELPAVSAAAREHSRWSTLPTSKTATELQATPAVTAAFIHHVQPLLYNACGTAACHGPRSHGRFRLTTPAANTGTQTSAARMNLQMALRFVDVHNPDGSPLITTHHPENSSVGFLDDIQRLTLLNWIQEVRQTTPAHADTRVPAPEAVIKFTKDATVGAPPTDERPRRTPASKQEQEVTSPTRNSTLPDQPVSAKADSPAGDSIRDAGQPHGTKEFEPRDPFDPEIFNRRYFPHRYRQSQ